MENSEGKTFSVLLFQSKLKFNNLPSYFTLTIKTSTKKTPKPSETYFMLLMLMRFYALLNLAVEKHIVSAQKNLW